VNRQPRTALDAHFRGQVGHALVGRDVLRAAVGIPAVVERVHAHEDVVRAEHLGPRERERQEDRVARGHVGHRDAAADLVDRPVLGDGDVARERGAAERAQVDRHDGVVTRAELPGDEPRALDLDPMALPVVERQRVDLESLGVRDGGGRRGIDTAAQEHDRLRRAHARNVSPGLPASPVSHAASLPS
jgi:hypothetical protein